MSRTSFETPSITSFRARIRSILEVEANAERSRNVVILAIDGISYDVACELWTNALNDKMRSVFPTTSSAAWLSSLSGMSVDDHGIPGVVFKISDHEEAIQIFDYKGKIFDTDIENIFSDAIGFGYSPLSIVGDLESCDCSWRDLLLRHSITINDHRFYRLDNGPYKPRDPAVLSAQVRRAVFDSLATHSRRSPSLLWCFIETDRHVHEYGNDEHVVRFLESIEQIAEELTRANCIVIAHSDHGLTRTSHSRPFEELIEQVKRQYQCCVGGAGRTRWLYPRVGTQKEIAGELTRSLPTSIRIDDADNLFSRGSLARQRVGAIVLIAEAEEFLAVEGYKFDHGSLTKAELEVPFSTWE